MQNSSPSRKSVAVMVQDGKSKSISSLAFMGKLKCDKNAAFELTSENERRELFDLAISRSENAKRVYQNVRAAASDGNAYVIGTLIKNKEQLNQPSLFGNEFEIWLLTAFSKLASQANKNSGSHYVQFYEM